MYGTEIVTKEYLDRMYDEFSREVQNLQNKLKEEPNETKITDITKQISMLNSFLNPVNLWVMGFHQDHEEKDVVAQEHFVPHFEESYNMLFMQRLDELNKASETLEKIGYYNNWNQEDFQNILNRRSK